MIGNDIVDLNYATQNSRWKEQRFLDKLFSEKEQDFIKYGGDRAQNIWRLWSMKESAYKMIARADGIVRFNPKDFICEVDNYSWGRVTFKEKSMLSITEINPRYVQTTAFQTPQWISKVISFGYSKVTHQRKEIYFQIAEFYARWKGIPLDGLDIKKDKLGIPHFFQHETLQPEQLSISHHGCFAAWAIIV